MNVADSCIYLPNRGELLQVGRIAPLTSGLVLRIRERHQRRAGEEEATVKKGNSPPVAISKATFLPVAETPG